MCQMRILSPHKFVIGAAALLFLCLNPAPCPAVMGFQDMRVQDGTLYFEDGSEVRLWGVNFQAALSAEYELMVQRNLFRPFIFSEYQRMIEDSFEELKTLGVDIIRLKISADDITDAEGNLVENDWLGCLDYVMKEAQRSGMYIYVTLCNPHTEGAIPDSFVNRFRDGEIFYLEEEQQLLERYLKQLLNRRNPYDGNRVYKDNPAWVIVEPIHEPAYLKRDEIRESYPRVEVVYQEWLKSEGHEDTAEYFELFRYTHAKKFIERMIEFFRSEQDRMVMTWGLGGSRSRERDGDDPFRAFLDSGNRLYSFTFYPGQEEIPPPPKDSIDLSDRDWFPFFREVYSDPNRLGWQMEERFRNRHARIVCEFEALANHNASTYPALATFFRSLGAQVAIQWTYRLTGYARCFSGPYNFNLKTTPRKAAAFMVAGEVFKNTPRFAPYPASGEELGRSGPGYYSREENASAFSDDDSLLYSGNVGANDLSSPVEPKFIVGMGRSPLVRYEGNSLVELEYFGPDLQPVQGDILDKFRSFVFRKLNKELVYNWKLRIYPEAEWKVEPWRRETGLNQREVLVDLLDEVAYPLTIQVPQGMVRGIVRIDEKNRQTVNFKSSPSGQTFKAGPGEYELAIDYSGE
jgi:hypothetical protein